MNRNDRNGIQHQCDREKKCNTCEMHFTLHSDSLICLHPWILLTLAKMRWQYENNKAHFLWCTVCSTQHHSDMKMNVRKHLVECKWLHVNGWMCFSIPKNTIIWKYYFFFIKTKNSQWCNGMRMIQHTFGIKSSKCDANKIRNTRSVPCIFFRFLA